MIVTLFTTPRPLSSSELFGIIQRNALTSWSLLNPRPEIVVFADEQYEGQDTIDFVLGLGFRVEPVLRRSSRRVPRLDDLFPRAQEMAGDGLPCYVNADIILENNLLPALEQASEPFEKCLLIARRWCIQMLELMDFSEGWEQRLKQKVSEQGSLMVECAIDLFSWKGDVYREFKPFAIGRYRWDNWLVGNALVRGCPVVDISRIARLTHQSHANVPWEDPDASANFQIPGAFCSLKDSTHTLTENGIVNGWLG